MPNNGIGKITVGGKEFIATKLAAFAQRRALGDLIQEKVQAHAGIPSLLKPMVLLQKVCLFRPTGQTPVLYFQRDLTRHVTYSTPSVPDSLMFLSLDSDFRCRKY